jgi:hypothetical protein
MYAAILSLAIWIGVLGAVGFAREKTVLLRELDLTVIQDRSETEGMLSRSVYQQIRKANRRSTAGWDQISTRGEWERYLEGRLARLRESLGVFPDLTGPPKVHVTGELLGDGYRELLEAHYRLSCVSPRKKNSGS